MRRSVVLCIAAFLALAVSPAVTRAAAPGASTGAATEVTATSATLNGVVNPNKEDTTYFFEYGTTTAYGTRTPDQPAVSGNAGKEVKVDVTGLTPSTTYHFRLVATNPSGSETGNDGVFTTQASPYTLPPNPPGQGANAVTITAVPAIVRFGRSTVIAGQVTGPKNGAVTVDLQANPHPFTAGFKNVATAVTDATGKYTFTVRPTAFTRYQVVAKASPPVTSPVVEVRVRYAVAFKANDYTARRGQRIKFSGSVKPAHDGRTVRIQRRRSNGTYRTIARTRLRDSATPGRSTYVKRLRVYRTAVYRVRISADADHATGTSRKRRVRVR